MWIFFTTNVHDNLTDFMIVGNLGSDGSGTVTEHVFDAVPHTRFVKRECGDEEGDPSVNNMIIIESTQPGPTNSQLRLCPRSTLSTALELRQTWTIRYCQELHRAHRFCTFSTARRAARV